MKYKKYLLLLFCALFLITGCKKIPKLENGAEVLVEVDGKQFTANEFFDELKERYGTNVLVNFVNNYITEKEINDDLIKSAKEQAEAEFNYYKSLYKTQWSAFLSNYGYNSDNDFMKDLEESYKQEEVVKKYIKESVITDEEINEYYDKNIAGEITVRHILIKTNTTDSMTDSEKTEAKKKALESAKEIIDTLNKSENLENDFIELAKEKSDDSTASEGGLIENFTNESGLVEAFYDASAKLEVGKMTAEPVETKYGYHVIYKVKQNDKPALDTVREKVISNICDELLSATNAKDIYWMGLREKYGMKIYDSIISDTYKAAANNLKKQS